MRAKQDADQPTTGKSALQRERRCFLAATCSLAPALALAGRLPQLERSGDATPAERLSTEARVDEALRQFGRGFHCAQSVMEAYATDFGLDRMVARRLANALAGGSGIGGECGALASGYLVLGLRYGDTTPVYGDVEKEKELFDRIARLVSEFKKRHGAITCRELLGVDVFTKEGREQALRKNLFVFQCENYIRDVIEILESLG